MSTAYNLILRAQAILQDTTGQQWSEEDLLREVNAGRTMVAVMAPDACTVKRPVQLVEGVRQQLPVDCIEAMGVTRNLGADGLTVGDVIFPIDLANLSGFIPGWEAGTPATTISGFHYDPGLPREFIVYPPAVAGVYVEVAMRVNPSAIVYDDAGVWQTVGLGINSKYEEALLEFVLFRAYAKDSEDAQNLNRSSQHQQAFMGLAQSGGGSRPPSAAEGGQ